MGTLCAYFTHHAARWRPATFYRLLYQRVGHETAAHQRKPGYKYSLAFVGYGEESETAVIELTYNWGVDSYELGTAYGHIALSVDNAAEACERIRQNGATSPVKPGR